MQVLHQSAYVSLRWLTVNMTYHKWTVLNTKSKMVYYGACNIQFIELARFKYGIYKPWEVEHQIKKLVPKRTRFFIGCSTSLGL